jgi:hypothetical protein
MGQFKPMVKMETTEPSVELKLKKGGSVKKADGGMMGMPSSMPAMPARGGSMPAASPMRPSLASRRRLMKGMPAGAAPAAPVGPMSAMMKKGGEAKEDMKADMGQDKAMIKKAFKQHDMQEHKGGKGTKLALKKGGMATGGVALGNGGGFATGGVVNGQGGYATGGVALGNGGGFKKGGATKKHYATGGSVNSTGSAVAMPQGRKPASKPVAINELSGTYKKGGSVAPGNRQLIGVSDSENAPAMRAAKADSNLKYGPASKMKLKDGGKVDLSKGAYDATLEEPPVGMGFAKKAHKFMDKLFGADSEAGAGRGFVNPKSVTKSKESVTVAPMKKGGSAKC